MNEILNKNTLGLCIKLIPSILVINFVLDHKETKAASD